MNIKQMAAAQTAKIVGAIVLGAIAVNIALEFYPTETKWIGLVGFLAYLIYQMYGMQLDKLERENSLKKLKDLG